MNNANQNQDDMKLLQKIVAMTETLSDEQAGMLIKNLANKEPVKDGAISAILLALREEYDAAVSVSSKRAAAGSKKALESFTEEKVKPLAERIDKFSEMCQNELEAKNVPQADIDNFISYWTEAGVNDVKFRAEKEKTFEPYKRYARYIAIYGKTKQQPQKAAVARQTQEALEKNAQGLKNAFLWQN